MGQMIKKLSNIFQMQIIMIGVIEILILIIVNTMTKMKVYYICNFFNKIYIIEVNN